MYIVTKNFYSVGGMRIACHCRTIPDRTDGRFRETDTGFIRNGLQSRSNCRRCVDDDLCHLWQYDCNHIGTDYQDRASPVRCNPSGLNSFVSFQFQSGIAVWQRDIETCKGRRYYLGCGLRNNPSGGIRSYSGGCIDHQPRSLCQRDKERPHLCVAFFFYDLIWLISCYKMKLLCG